MARDARPEPNAAARAVAGEIGFAKRLLRAIGGRLALALVFIALPLWSFGEFAEEVLDGEPFAFDTPLLRLLHATAGPEADSFFVLLSAAGFAWGVIPADVVLVATLVLRRRFREATFAVLALAGSGLINGLAKHSFRRERPSLWESIAPEATYSFPSGHAMASATLVGVLLALAWCTRVRGVVLILGIPFVVGVGLSRVYLGVHYPSDILAGWAVATAWVVAVYLLVFARGRRPWDGRRAALRRVPSGRLI